MKNFTKNRWRGPSYWKGLMAIFIALMSFGVQSVKAQINVGTGTVVNQAIPIEPYYGYTYSQVIYTAADINAAGSITGVKYYATPSTTLANSSSWVVYIGTTTKTSFSSTTDWEPIANLTQKFSGTATISGGEVIITFTTPFVYNGTSNLIVAVDENKASYDGGSDDFYCTSGYTNRALSYRNDNTNPSPASPPTATYRQSSIANIQFMGISQACPTPSALTAAALATTANLGWTENGSSTAWEVEWSSTPNFAQGTGTAVAASANPHALTGLTANTAYSYYVRAACGLNDSSAWVGPFAFTTACVNVAPWNEDFNNNGSIPSCWSTSAGASSSGWEFGTPAFGWQTTNCGAAPSDHTGNGSEYAAVNLSGTDVNTILETGPIDVSNLAATQLEFYYYMCGVGYTPLNFLYVEAFDGTNWNGIDTIQQGTVGWEEFSYNISSHVYNTNYVNIRFRSESGGSSVDYYGDQAIDDIAIFEAPTCPKPEVLTVASITSSGATLGWTEMGSATTWHVEYGDNGFTQGLGTTVTASNDSLVVTTMNPISNYEFYVRSFCAVGDSSIWVGPMAFTTNCTGSLSGTYTLDPATAISATNYQTMESFIQQLNICGIGAAVTLNVTANSGPYVGPWDFTTVLGASATNTVTINGNGNLVNKNTGENHFVRFEGTEYVTINDFEFINQTPNTAMFGIQMKNASDHISITNNMINIGTGFTTSLSACIAASNSNTSATTYGNNANNVTVSGNEMIGGYYGVALSGTSSSVKAQGHIVSNNNIHDFYSYGVRMYYADSNLIDGNEFSRANRATMTTFYAIYGYYFTNSKIMNNRIHSNGVSTSAAYPIYVGQSSNTSGSETEIVNNAIYNLQSTGTIYGMYLISTRNYINVYHNTVEISTAGTSTRRGIYSNGAPNNHNVKNNIVSISGAGTGTATGIYSSSTSSTFSTDYNVVNVNASGTNYYGYWSGYKATLALWQTGTTDGVNSSELNPVFADPANGNFSPLSMNIDNMASLVGVTTDIDGTTRNATTPDVGAIEFTGVPGDLALTAIMVAQEDACYGSSDTAFALVTNVLPTISDFATDPLTIVWNVTGPVNTTDSLVVNTGSLGASADSVFSITGIDMSIPGDYTVSAYIKPNAVNPVASNDSIMNGYTETVQPIISAIPDSVTVTNSLGTGLMVSSPFIATGFSVVMTDSYGDGWNGNQLEVTSGSQVANISITGGYTGTANFTGAAGDTINLNYLAGGLYNNEVSFELFDGYGNLMYSSGTNPSSGYHYGSNIPGYPGTLSWDSAGTTVGTAPQQMAGAFTTSGVYPYIVTYTNVCGTYSDTSIVTVDLTNATMSAFTNVSCNAGDNGTATVTAGGGDSPYTYLWSNGDSTMMADSLMAGTYTVTVYDANMWPATATVTITEPTAISGTTSTTPSTCGVPSGSATVAAAGGTGAYTYLWSNGATTAVAASLVGGSYDVTVTDANMCTAVYSATVSDIGAPAITIAVDNIVTCFGDSTGQVTATATGGSTPYAYAWSSGGTVATEGNLPLGMYTVVLTDGSGCVSNATVNMTQNPALLAVVTGSTDPLCNGDATGTATSIAGGGVAPYSFLWSNGDAIANASALAAGTHSVMVTDAVGCMQSANVNISQPNQLAGVFVNVMDVACNGSSTGSAGILATGGTAPYTYSWSNGSTSSNATALAAGSYSVTIADANNCSMSDNVTIAEPTALVASTTGSTDAACFGGNTGTASATATGGTMPYVYAWSNGAGGTLATGLAAGTYTVSVNDANNCSSTATIVVGQPAMVVSVAVTSTNASCNGVSDGGATAIGAGGTAGYSYAWSNGGSTAAISGLAAGSYMVTATDVNGCMSSSSASVTEPTMLMATATATDVTCNGGNDGQTMAMATGGTAPYSYVWNNGPTTALNDTVMAGTYSAVVMDANGCMANASAMVSEPMPVMVSLGADVTICSDEVFTLDAGSGYASYAWDDASTAQTRDIDAAVAGSGASNYSVTVLTAAGCEGMDTITVTVADPVTTSIIFNGSSTICQYESTSMDAGPGFASYTWSNTSNSQTINIYAASQTVGMNTFTVTVTDANGCEGVAMETVEVYPEVIFNLGADTAVWQNAIFTIEADSGYASYTWNTGATTQNLDVTTAGTYSVVVTDSLTGCAGSDEMVVDFILSVDGASAAQLKLYPNPAVDYINLEFSNFVQQGVVEIQILSITGQLVKTVNVDVSANNGTGLIDVSRLAVGTYMVTFDYDGETVVKQFTIK